MTLLPNNTPAKHVHELRGDNYTLGESAHAPYDLARKRASEALDQLIALAKRGERQRQPTEATVIKRIEKATGKTVTGVTVAPDGTVTCTFGAPSADSGPNEWNEVLPNAANKKRPA
jgi:hypothetical protein